MNNIHKILYTLEGEEWTKLIDKVYHKKNNLITVRGFRKGKAPKNLFIKQYGLKKLLIDTLQENVQSFADKALEGKDLKLECRLNFEIKTLSEDKVEIEITAITRPEVKLDKYKNFGIKMEEATVSDEEVNKATNQLLSKYAEISEKEDGTIEMGDIAVIDFEGYVDNEKFEGGSLTDYDLEIGSNTFIPGFESSLVGAKKGDLVDVNVTFPEDYQASNLQGKDALFKVTVKNVKKRTLPELNEEFFEDLDMKDIKNEEELRNKLKEELLNDKKQKNEDEYYNKIFKEALNHMTVEINDEIIENELNIILNDFARRLKNSGVSLEQYLEFYHLTEDKLKEQSRPEAIRRLKERYLLDEIIKLENIQATEEEVEDHRKELAETYNVSEEEITNSYGGNDKVKYDLLVHKAIDVLESNE